MGVCLSCARRSDDDLFVRGLSRFMFDRKHGKFANMNSRLNVLDFCLTMALRMWIFCSLEDVWCSHLFMVVANSFRITTQPRGIPDPSESARIEEARREEFLAHIVSVTEEYVYIAGKVGGQVYS